MTKMLLESKPPRSRIPWWRFDRTLPTCLQEPGSSRVLEPPLDFTGLAEKYSRFAVDFVHAHREERPIPLGGEAIVVRRCVCDFTCRYDYTWHINSTMISMTNLNLKRIWPA